jgi:hypothetical protein
MWAVFPGSLRIPAKRTQPAGGVVFGALRAMQREGLEATAGIERACTKLQSG